MNKNLENKIKTLNDASFIPNGLNIPIEMKIVDIRATSYFYWGNKYAEANESFENNALSIKINHSKVDKDFWITIFKGATYRDEDTQCIIATFEPTIDENFNLLSSENTHYEVDCISKSEDIFDGLESINEVLFAFKCRLFDGDDAQLYTSDGATFDKNSNVLKDVVDEIIDLSFVLIDEKISKEEPNSKQLKEINNILFSAASNNLYAVTVVQDSCIKKVEQYLEKDDAEKLFVKYCLEYYNENGLEQYCENKGCRSLDELSIEEFEYYFHSEAWYDVNDTANVEIKVM